MASAIVWIRHKTLAILGECGVEELKWSDNRFEPIVCRGCGRCVIIISRCLSLICCFFPFVAGTKNPFQNLLKEINVNGETFHYYDIASFPEYREYRPRTTAPSLCDD